MKTQGEIESAICEGMARFEQEYMGRGPKDIHTHLIGDLLVVRLHGVLTAAEKQLVKSLSAEKGRDLLKQVRTQLIETARPVMEAMIQDATGAKVLSVHHDISTLTGEEVVLFLRGNSERGFTSPVGFGQGVYRVGRSAAGVSVVDDLHQGAPRELTEFLEEVTKHAAPP